MKTKELAKATERFPFMMDEFFRPWNEWFDGDRMFMGKTMTIPAVNIRETKDDYMLSLAVPGMKKDDFKVDLEGNMLTVSCEKEETMEKEDVKFNRKEYNYTSFSRSFTLPEEVKREGIDARYEDGILKMLLPKKEEFKKQILTKHIAIK